MPPIFRRGSKALHKAIDGKQTTYIANCNSCIYQKENGCTNPNVTSYDMVESDEKTYCCFWSCHFKKEGNM